MKRSIGILSIAILFTGLSLTSCTTSADDVEDAQEDINDAKQDLKEANEAYKEDMKEYKERTAKQILANEVSIQEFNARIATQKSDAKADYEQKIAELNSKNSDMKKRMEDFQADSESSWEKFKTEFAQDMDKLGTSIHDFTVKNEK